MSTLLRLYIPAEWPTQEASCEWTLVDTTGRQLQRGRSDARHWPAADECELVLSADQCLLLGAQLPKVSRSRLPEVIRFAVEDHLLGDAEAEHFVAGDKAIEDATPVWVVSRPRLKTLLAALSSASRTPRRAYSELQLAPLAAGRWTVCLREMATGESPAARILGFVRTGTEQGYAIDGGDRDSILTPPLELRLALQNARNAGAAPAALALYTATGRGDNAAAIATAWQEALGLPVQVAGEYTWQDYVSAAATARNLLVQDFAPPRRARDGWGSFRPAMYLALASCALLGVFVVGDWAWLNYQSHGLQEQMTATFRTAFPQIQTLVDPPLQMQRLYDQQRREHGQLGNGDFLPLLAGATEVAVGQGKLNLINYEEGRLELSFIVANAEIANVLRDAMKGRGLFVTLRDTQPLKNGGKGIEAVYALRGSP